MNIGDSVGAKKRCVHVRMRYTLSRQANGLLGAARRSSRQAIFHSGHSPFIYSRRTRFARVILHRSTSSYAASFLILKAPDRMTNFLWNLPARFFIPCPQFSGA